MERSQSLTSLFTSLSLTVNQLQTSLINKFPRKRLSELASRDSKAKVLMASKYKLEGHNERIYSLSWAGSGDGLYADYVNILATVSGDGAIIVWNARKGKPVYKWMIMRDDPWLMSCCFEKSRGEMLAVGGADGSIHIVQMGVVEGDLQMREQPLISFSAHNSYISAIEYISSHLLITASGDSTIRLWKMQEKTVPVVLRGHMEDVMCMNLNMVNTHLLISGGCDNTIRIWDIRLPRYQRVILQDSHVNTINFMPGSEFTFVAGTNNGVARIYDTRSYCEVAEFRTENSSSISSACFSHSGRLLYLATDDGNLSFWDIFRESNPLQHLAGHSDKITSIALSPRRDTLASCSYDKSLIIWQKLP